MREPDLKGGWELDWPWGQEKEDSKGTEAAGPGVLPDRTEGDTAGTGRACGPLGEGRTQGNSGKRADRFTRLGQVLSVLSRVTIVKLCDEGR